MAAVRLAGAAGPQPPVVAAEVTVGPGWRLAAGRQDTGHTATASRRRLLVLLVLQQQQGLLGSVLCSCALCEGTRARACVARLALREGGVRKGWSRLGGYARSPCACLACQKSGAAHGHDKAEKGLAGVTMPVWPGEGWARAA